MIKMEPISIATIVGLLFTIPIGWLFNLVRTTNKRIDDMQRNHYDKAETDKMIELHLKPVLQSVENVKADTTEIKHLIGKLFDGQAKS